MSRILVVEDDPLNRKLVSLILRRAGYEVDTASDASDAERRIGTSPPDLILMDLDLPGKDGITYASELRRRKRTAGTPIVAVTAYPLTWGETATRASGCNDYVTKPYNDSELLRRVRRWLARSMP
ncbi:MAG: response regulator [Thermoplasmata archaeon]